MTTMIGSQRNQPPASAAAPTQRRSLLLGAATAGAAALAAKALPLATQPPAADSIEPALPQAGGYQLTAHVMRYYETTKV